MVSALHSVARYGIYVSLRLFERLRGIDVVLFYLSMLVKLHLFNRSIHVRQMEVLTFNDNLVALGTLGLLTFWTLWLPLRGRMIVLVAMNLGLTFIVFANLVYFRYFQDLISLPVLLQAGQLGAVEDSIRTLIGPSDLWLFADWPFAVSFALYLLVNKRKSGMELRFVRPSRLRRFAPRFTAGMIVAVVSLPLVIMPINKAANTWAQGVFVGNWWNLSLYNVTGLFGFHAYDVWRYADQHWFHHEKLTGEEVNETGLWLEGRGNERDQLQSDPLFGAYRGRNVIMIQAEALQNFVINASYKGQEITPVMNRLLKESAYFSRFYHQTALGRTSDADFAANCSMHPASSGSAFIRFAQHTFDCLPGILKDNGYSATAYHAYDGGFWNRNTMYANMNYDSFMSKKHYTIDEPIGWSLGDKSFFRQSMDVIAAQKQPFYSFLITLSSHHPYTLPKDLRLLDLGDLNGTLFGNYIQSIHYMDAALGELVARLKQEGLWDNMIVVIYGDHDSSIKDWSQFEQFIGKPLSPLERQQVMKQVPLIIHFPGSKHAGIYEQVGGQLDLSPTIMHLLGIPSSEYAMLGKPLLTKQPLEGRTVVFRNGAYTDGVHYFIPSGDGIVENGTCYELSTGEPGDPRACIMGADKAKQELIHSDRVVEQNLLSLFGRKPADAR